MRKYLIFFSFFFTLCLVSAPFPVPQKPDESHGARSFRRRLARSLLSCLAAGREREFFIRSGAGPAIAALTESFSAGEPDLKTTLNRRKRNTENVIPGTKISGDESAEPYRDLLELVRLLKKLDSSPLLPENFRNWRRNMLQRLLETQQRDGSWGNVPSTFYALCCLRLIL